MEDRRDSFSWFGCLSGECERDQVRLLCDEDKDFKALSSLPACVSVYTGKRTQSNSIIKAMTLKQTGTT